MESYFVVAGISIYGENGVYRLYDHIEGIYSSPFASKEEAENAFFKNLVKWQKLSDDAQAIYGEYNLITRR